MIRDKNGNSIAKPLKFKNFLNFSNYDLPKRYSTHECSLITPKNFFVKKSNYIEIDKDKSSDEIVILTSADVKKNPINKVHKFDENRYSKEELKTIKQAIKSGQLSNLEEIFKDVIYDNEIKVGDNHQVDLNNLSRGFKMFRNVNKLRDCKVKHPHLDEIKEKEQNATPIICVSSYQSILNIQSTIDSNNRQSDDVQMVSSKFSNLIFNNFKNTHNKVDFQYYNKKLQCQRYLSSTKRTQYKIKNFFHKNHLQKNKKIGESNGKEKENTLIN
jgi:uncharacterized protein YcbK (DUF882 family)